MWGYACGGHVCVWACMCMGMHMCVGVYVRGMPVEGHACVGAYLPLPMQMEARGQL